MALRSRGLAAQLALFLALAVLHTWPLASDPAHLSRLDNDDTAFNTWTVAWVAHQLPRDPRNLFQAPIFYPEVDTLAYSEHLIAQAIMASAANDMDGTEMPVTINVRPVGGALRDSQPLCIDVCAGIFGAEICIHVVIPATLVDLF